LSVLLGNVFAMRGPMNVKFIAFFFENRLHCQFDFQLLLFTVRTCV